MLTISNVTADYYDLPYSWYMISKKETLRKILSLNIKRQRKLLGISQEKLAEKAGISVNMIKDIEGCRTWVSDKTLIRLASAVNTDIYRLFLPSAIPEDEIYKVMLLDMVKVLQKIKNNIDSDLENTLKMWNLDL